MRRMSHYGLATLIVLLLLTLVFPAFAQNETKGDDQTPQIAPQEEAPFTVPFDIRTLYPLEKSFLILRDGKPIWLTEKDMKEENDMQLMWSQSFSRDENSKDVIAEALYPLDKTEHCALRWVEKNASELFGLVFENGKMFVWPGSQGIGYYVLAHNNQPNVIIGIRIYLMDDKGQPIYLKNNQGKAIMLYRDFMISAPNTDADKVRA